MNITVTKQKLSESVVAHKACRSAWARGVKAYAVELVEGMDDGADLSNEVMLAKALLNGASSWAQYSEGGAALTWLDVQARALWQAHRLIVSKWEQMKRVAL